MQAMRIHRYGGPDVIVADDIPRPSPGPGEVLVRVAATSFNPSEIGLREGLLRDVLPLTFPHTLGWDVSGTVDGTGERVVARLDRGGAAGYAVAPAADLVRVPNGVDLVAAAALPIAGVTALQAVETAALRPGQRVLVTGAGGGVGGFATQLAARAGAEVVTAAEASSVDTLLHLAPAKAPVDAVRPGGTVVSITGPVAAPTTVRSTHFVVAPDPERLATLLALVASGDLRIAVAATRPLSELAEVHRDAALRRTRGKTVLVPG